MPIPNFAIALEASVDSGGPISLLLRKWQAGDSEALNALVPLVYADLRKLAHRYLRKQRPDHTLQSTPLVHEAYLRLAEHEKMRFENRAHFFAVLARIMRQILVDYARRQHAAKRDAGINLVLDEAIATSLLRQVSVVVLDDALTVSCAGMIKSLNWKNLRNTLVFLWDFCGRA